MVDKIELSKEQKARSVAHEKFSYVGPQIGFLEGKMLTIVDASYSDREQRDAVKSLVKRTLRDWRNRIITLLVDHETGQRVGSVGECPPQSG